MYEVHIGKEKTSLYNNMHTFIPGLHSATDSSVALSNDSRSIYSKVNMDITHVHVHVCTLNSIPYYQWVFFMGCKFSLLLWSMQETQKFPPIEINKHGKHTIYGCTYGTIMGGMITHARLAMLTVDGHNCHIHTAVFVLMMATHSPSLSTINVHTHIDQRLIQSRKLKPRKYPTIWYILRNHQK